MQAMPSEMSEMVWWCTTETVVSHWGTCGCVWRDRDDLDDREEQRGTEGLALLDWGKLRG